MADKKPSPFSFQEEAKANGTERSDRSTSDRKQLLTVTIGVASGNPTPAAS